MTVPSVLRGLAVPDPLVDRHGRRQAIDRVDVGPLELIKELAGIAGQAFEVAALALGIDGVKSQRAFSRPADARQDDQTISRQVDVDVLQVVHPRAAHLDRGRRSVGLRPRRRSGRLRTGLFRTGFLHVAILFSGETPGPPLPDGANDRSVPRILGRFKSLRETCTVDCGAGSLHGNGQGNDLYCVKS